ncbi:MAG: trypsin-like serine protease, partial [Bosea sp.]|uniref:S1C family serine protease n=1 Tax=Bosea sp. (in: a-proteobacteria) TaxID=1871050 RepID=UPI0023A4E255|nr:trypsin-like serine protease [Bosea sp. (in: a-proteobacteria)]
VLSDGRRFKADYIAGDEGSDVAVVRMLEPPDDLPVAPLGDSDSVRVGQFAIAIGAPFGFSSSFTVGHVSAMGRRSIGGQGPGGPAPGFERLKYQNFLQVDAAINPGNSGGPLVDVHGNVIGINTAIASTAGHGSGVGFSIPINMAQRIADQLMSEGKVTRGWLGVGLDDINTAEAEAFGLSQTTGARI